MLLHRQTMGGPRLGLQASRSPAVTVDQVALGILHTQTHSLTHILANREQVQTGIYTWCERHNQSTAHKIESRLTRRSRSEDGGPYKGPLATHHPNQRWGEISEDGVRAEWLAKIIQNKENYVKRRHTATVSIEGQHKGILCLEKIYKVCARDDRKWELLAKCFKRMVILFLLL